MTEPTPEVTEAPKSMSLEEAALEVFGAPPDDAPKAEPVEEAAAVEEVKPEPVSPKIIAAKRAEAKAAKERAELRAQREEQVRKDEELTQRELQAKLIEEDPARYFEIKKLGAAGIRAHLEKLAGTNAPEAIADKKLTAHEERIAQLEAELKSKREQEQQALDARGRHVAATEFVRHVGEAADKYPALTKEFTENEAVGLAFSELRRVIAHDKSGKPITRVEAYFAEHGEYPNHDVIAEFLEQIAQKRIEARSKSAWGKRGDALDSASQAAGQQKQVPPVKGTSPRTLTSRDASQRPTPPRTGEMTQEELDAECIRMLEATKRRTG
jgi:hypothetical protein